VQHIQISGYYTEDTNLEISYLLTKSSLAFEITVIDTVNNLILDYTLNPDYEDILKLENKYCEVPNELFKSIFVGLYTQCFWNDAEVDALRAQFSLLGITTHEEFVKYLIKRFKGSGSRDAYDLIYDIASRADIKKIWNMLGDV
jgi:hypothetical protein